ncbi:MAG: hypothetical protein EPO42_12345 [Gallionellaceae bacterium]|nr:MAG: hypothetical protein EPO42_12345 [Gallionellaceae bacterium]
MGNVQRCCPPKTQRGVALLIMLLIIVMGSLAFVVGSLSKPAASIERDKITAANLVQAKEALVAFAVTVRLNNGCTGSNCARPGDLPCPDSNNDGIAENVCGNASGSTGQNSRLGRLPWKTLGLPDLRDSSGERLWYAVSNNFKNNARTVCTTAGAGCLNSDALGTITVFSPEGDKLNDAGSAGTGAVALVISPGEALTRQGGTMQDRGSANQNNAMNYLDIATVNGATHDNQSFIDSSTTDGFIRGRIKDSAGNVVLNDQLLVISQSNIMSAIQKRVAAEVRQCLAEYANDPQNNGHLPWSAPIKTSSAPSYQDKSGHLFGRVPSSFPDTGNDSGGNMTAQWGPTCNTHNNNTESGWWINWKEMVFYALAAAYKPAAPPDPLPPNICTNGGTCLTVNPPTSSADKKFVVIVSGKMLPGQNRYSTNATTANIHKGTLSNYLESPNPTVYNSPPSEPAVFSPQSFSSSFNDTIVFQ